MNAWVKSWKRHIGSQRGIRYRLAAALLMTMAIGLIAPTPAAQAATITVDSTLDNVIAGDGACTLREAVNNANANSDTTAGDCTAGSGPDEITLPAGVYTLGTGVEDANASGDLDIMGSGGHLTIRGAGLGVTTISGPGHVVFTDRILDIDPDNSGNIVVTVQDLTLEEGHTGQGGGAIYNRGDSLVLENVVIRNCSATFGGGSSYNGNGGAIFNNGGNVTIRGSLITENKARGGVITTVGGGAIFNTSGQVEIVDSELADNQVQSIAGGTDSGANGGAIYNENIGQVTIRNTLIRGNFATGGTTGSIGSGGAIFNAGGARLDIQHSTLGDNHADRPGGALYNEGEATIRQSLLIVNGCGWSGGAIHHSGSGLTIEQSSLVSNIAGGYGGGVFTEQTMVAVNSTLAANVCNVSGGGLANASGDVTLINVTVTQNRADHNGEGSGDGGGVQNGGGVVRLRNALIADNVDNSESATVHPDLSGSFVSEGHNLIGDGSGSSGLINGIGGDQVGTSGSPINPLLAMLAYNGHYTPAYDLLPGSPALNNGGNNGCPAVDQWGTARPVGPFCDIGAIEAVHFVYLPLTLAD